jgi:long-subunit fatty acid transport protein
MLSVVSFKFTDELRRVGVNWRAQVAWVIEDQMSEWGRGHAIHAIARELRTVSSRFFTHFMGRILFPDHVSTSGAQKPRNQWVGILTGTYTLYKCMNMCMVGCGGERRRARGPGCA